MLWICAENSVNNAKLIAEQHLHRDKAFFVSHTASPVRRLGLHKKLGGNTAGTADPK